MAPILPPELWSIIVDNLSRSDQLYISEVSSQLCAVARRAIYRKVYLQYDGGDSEQATIELLLRDQSVARLVKHLHLEDFVGAPREPAWFDADALSGMTRLQQLSLLGMPFRTEDDQVKFNKIASESLPALRILEYRALVFTKQWESSKRKREEHLPVLQIVGLQQITWIDPDAFAYPSSILPLVTASRETLTEIFLLELTTSTAISSSLTEFLSLHFPCLSTIHLDCWSTTVPVDDALTNFLIAHPLIEDLRLDFQSSPYENELHCHISANVILDPGTLPNLRHLKADAFNLNNFARSRLLSLQKLKSLHTGVGPGEGGKRARFARMYKALEACGGLPQLETLELELNGAYDDLKNTHWITGFGVLCPKMVRFSGDMIVGWTADTKQFVFASYSNLRILTIPDIGFSSKQEKTDWIKELAVHNSSVTDLYFTSTKDIDIIDFLFLIKRNVDGKIAGIVEVLEDGRHDWIYIARS